MLEEELDVSLFTRHGRGMVLTAEGQTLLERASAILRMVDDTRSELASGAGIIKGTVSLGVPPTAGEVLAGPLVERFARQYPDVTIRIVPAFSGYLLDMLQRGEIDLAVMYETHTLRQIPVEPLIVERLYLVGSPTDGPGSERSIRFADLAGLPLILPGPRHGLRVLIENEAKRLGVELNVPIEADSLQVLKDLVSRGLGHTILPIAPVHNETQAGVLRALPITSPELTRKLVLVRSPMRASANAVRLFEETLKAQTVDMVRSGIWKGDLLISPRGD